jgi:hypothetical protein
MVLMANIVCAIDTKELEVMEGATVQKEDKVSCDDDMATIMSRCIFILASVIVGTGPLAFT